MRERRLYTVVTACPVYLPVHRIVISGRGRGCPAATRPQLRRRGARKRLGGDRACPCHACLRRRQRRRHLVPELGAIVRARKGLVRHGHAEVRAPRAPAVLHLEDEALRRRDGGLDRRVVRHVGMRTSSAVKSTVSSAQAASTRSAGADLIWRQSCRSSRSASASNSALGSGAKRGRLID